jgi:hypothetical protein
MLIVNPSLGRGTGKLSRNRPSHIPLQKLGEEDVRDRTILPVPLGKNR